MSASREIFNKDTLISFIINLSVFVIVWRILSGSLFSGFSNIFEKRGELVDGQRKRAQAFRLESEKLEREYEFRINAERAEIKKNLESVVTETEIKQRKLIERAREVSAVEINQARKRIAEEAERVRENLKKEIPTIAVQMASRIIGRELSL